MAVLPMPLKLYVNPAAAVRWLENWDGNKFRDGIHQYNHNIKGMFGIRDDNFCAAEMYPGEYDHCPCTGDGYMEFGKTPEDDQAYADHWVKYGEWLDD